MSTPEEDVAARGRSIFERLRAEQVAPRPVPTDEPGRQARVRWADLPVAQSRGRPDDRNPDRFAEDQATRWHYGDGGPPSEAQHTTPSTGDPGLQASGPRDSDAGVPSAATQLTDLPPRESYVASTEPAGSSPGAELNRIQPTRDARSEWMVLGRDPAPTPPGDSTPDASDALAPPAAPSDQPSTQRAEDYRAAVPVMPPLPAPGPTTLDPAQPHGSVGDMEADAASANGSDIMGSPGPFARPLPRVIAIANQKGGVGKTTTTVNLGASLAVLGYRVLVVDLDPQGNATTGLGINSRNLEHSIYDVILHDVALDDCIEPTSLRNLYAAPATIDLAGAEIELVPAFSRELRLRRALEQVGDDYDFVLIDCPPSLGLLTVNGLAAATEVLVPIQCEYYALEGLGQLLRNVNLVQSNLNPKLELSAIVLTMYDARTKLAEQVANEVRKHFGPKVCRNVVPRTVRLSEAPSFGQPIIVFDPSSRGALAYRELAKEVSGGAPQRAG